MCHALYIIRTMLECSTCRLQGLSIYGACILETWQVAKAALEALTPLMKASFTPCFPLLLPLHCVYWLFTLLVSCFFLCLFKPSFSFLDLSLSIPVLLFVALSPPPSIVSWLLASVVYLRLLAWMLLYHVFIDLWFGLVVPLLQFAKQRI